MVGFIGYDAVRRLERLPEIAKDDLELPELAMLFATDLAVLDHEDGSVLLIANAVNYDATDERVDEAWADARGPARRDGARRSRSRPTPLAVRLRLGRGARLPQQHRPRRLPRGGRAGQGGDPGRRGVPGRRVAAVRDRDRRRRPSTSTASCG